ncbi:MAG: FAD-dependent oxidoreductase [Oligoflexales bacterium]
MPLGFRPIIFIAVLIIRCQLGFSQVKINEFDIVIIGAGAMGSAAAYNLGLKGKTKVLVLERSGDAQKAVGSSTGASRITRKISIENPEYMSLNKKSFQLLHELEEKLETELIEPRELLTISSRENLKYFSKVKEKTISSKTPHKYLTNRSEILKNYPLLKLPNREYEAIVEFGGNGTGIMHADKIILTLRQEAKKKGIQFHYGEFGLKLSEVSGGIRIETNRSAYFAKKVIITASSSTKEFLSLPLQHVPQTLLFAPITSEKQKKMPILIVHDDDHLPHSFYSIPEQENLKYSFHVLGTAKAETYSWAHKILDNYFNIESKVEHTSSCFYTTTPDKTPIIGPVKAFGSNVIVGAGFQGNGFKMSLGIGDLLASFALGEKIIEDYSRFSPDRFKKEPSFKSDLHIQKPRV